MCVCVYISKCFLKLNRETNRNGSLMGQYRAAWQNINGHVTAPWWQNGIGT